MKKLKENDEVSGITGLLNTYGDTSHQFQSDNKCSYFMGKSELCFLSGRICLHDTITYPACATYAIGVEKHLPGVDGNEPDTPPQTSVKDIEGDNHPIDGQHKPLFVS